MGSFSDEPPHRLQSRPPAERADVAATITIDPSGQSGRKSEVR